MESLDHCRSVTPLYCALTYDNPACSGSEYSWCPCAMFRGCSCDSPGGCGTTLLAHLHCLAPVDSYLAIPSTSATTLPISAAFSSACRALAADIQAWNGRRTVRPPTFLFLPIRCLMCTLLSKSYSRWTRCEPVNKSCARWPPKAACRAKQATKTSPGARHDPPPLPALRPESTFTTPLCEDRLDGSMTGQQTCWVCSEVCGGVGSFQM